MGGCALAGSALRGACVCTRPDCGQRRSVSPSHHRCTRRRMHEARRARREPGIRCATRAPTRCVRCMRGVSPLRCHAPLAGAAGLCACRKRCLCVSLRAAAWGWRLGEGIAHRRCVPRPPSCLSRLAWLLGRSFGPPHDRTREPAPGARREQLRTTSACVCGPPSGGRAPSHPTVHDCC